MQEENDEISVKEIVKKLIDTIKFILSSWKRIVLFSLLGGALGLVIGLVTKPKFSGKLSYILEGASSTSGLASIASSFGISTDSEEGVFSNENLMAMLKSRNLVEKTLLEKIPNENTTFAEKYIKIYEMRDNWEDVPGIDKIKFKPYEDRSKFSTLKDSILRLVYTDIAENRLGVSIPIIENTIVVIEFVSYNQKISKYFPEKLIENATEFYVNSKTKKLKDNVQVLQKQVDSVRMELLRSISGVASSNDQIFALNPTMNVARVPSINKQVDVQANTAILTELVKNLEMSKMNLLNETPFVQIIDKPIFPLERKKMSFIITTIIGIFLTGFLTIVYLLVRRYLKRILNK